MLGLYLIIAITTYVILYWKLKTIIRSNTEFDFQEDTLLTEEPQTFHIDNRIINLKIQLTLILLISYILCLIPFFTHKPSLGEARDFLIGFFIIIPAFYFYYSLKNAIKRRNGHFSISTSKASFNNQIFHHDKHGYLNHPYPNQYTFICDPDKVGFCVRLNEYPNRETIRSLIRQFAVNYSHSNPIQQLYDIVYKLAHFIISKAYYISHYFLKYCLLVALLYTSWCCIDRHMLNTIDTYKDEFNAINANPSQPENAWPHYIAAMNYFIPPDPTLKEHLDQFISYEDIILNDEQITLFDDWFLNNQATWQSLQKATSIDYCNEQFEDYIYLKTSSYDDSVYSPDLGNIVDCYNYLTIGILKGNIQIDPMQIYQMQLKTADHFSNAKTIRSALIGLHSLNSSKVIMSNLDHYNLDQINKIRSLFNISTQNQLAPFNPQGDWCLAYYIYENYNDDNRFPDNTPLNPLYLFFGSKTSFINRFYTYQNEMFNSPELFKQSALAFSFEQYDIDNANANLLNGEFIPLFIKSRLLFTYKYYIHSKNTFPATHTILDLETYYLNHGTYPTTLNQLKDDYLGQHLPENTQPYNTIIYTNDGSEAKLYSFGFNNTDDNGIYEDNTKDASAPDDIIFWNRTLNQ